MLYGCMDDDSSAICSFSFYIPYTTHTFSFPTCLRPTETVRSFHSQANEMHCSWPRTQPSNHDACGFEIRSWPYIWTGRECILYVTCNTKGRHHLDPPESPSLSPPILPHPTPSYPILPPPRDDPQLGGGVWKVTRDNTS